MPTFRIYASYREKPLKELSAAVKKATAALKGFNEIHIRKDESGSYIVYTSSFKNASKLDMALNFAGFTVYSKEI
jgi:hypothetical protein